MAVIIDVNRVNIKYRYIRGIKLKSSVLSVLKDGFKGIGGQPELVWAVKNVSFQVYKGETLGIIGSNGAGKSTLLKALAKVFRPDSGSIILYTDSISLLALGTGFKTNLSGLENIYLSGLLLGLSKSELDEKLEGIIALLYMQFFAGV